MINYKTANMSNSTVIIMHTKNNKREFKNSYQ